MKTLAVIASFVFVVSLITMVAFVAYGPTGDQVRHPRENRVTVDLGRNGMLEADQPMLDRMRISVSPHTNGMFGEDPMWYSKDMIRSQEDYQAQLDRMVGRRSG